MEELAVHTKRMRGAGKGGHILHMSYKMSARLMLSGNLISLQTEQPMLMLLNESMF